MQKFIIETQMKTGTDIRILGQDARHISRVLRLKPGDTISMTDGRGMDAKGKIIQVGLDHVRAIPMEIQASTTESRLDLTLCTAMLKHKKMDQIIKQVTQLGITRWIPFFSSRSVPLSNPKKEARQMERWQTIVRESVKQCRRSRLVDILAPVEFEAVLKITENADHKLAFWEKGGSSLIQAENKKRSVVILIGPEGGFRESEIKLAVNTGFTSYSLGPRILRAETAAVCAAGLVQYIFGDLGPG